MENRTSRQARQQAARSKEIRLKRLRYGGLAVIVLALTGLIIGTTVARPAATSTATPIPHLDGPIGAPIQVVEYADLTCSACRQWHILGIKEQLQAEFGEQISFEYRHFPVITPSSPAAAEAAQCAAEQEMFWPLHDYIFENLEPYPELNSARLGEIATAIGLDRTDFDSCLDSGRYSSFVREAIREGQSAGVRGTPTFFINGQQVFPSFEAMAAVANQLLSN